MVYSTCQMPKVHYAPRMEESNRAERMRRDRGRALVRTLHLSELEAAGAARRLALHQADEQLDRIARLLPDALKGGLTLSDVARASGVSRPTLYELRARFTDQPGDLRFGVLQAVARMQMVSHEDVAEHLGRDAGEVFGVLRGLHEEKLVELEVRQTEEGDEDQWGLTPEGYETLEAWRFQDHEQEKGDGS